MNISRMEKILLFLTIIILNLHSVTYFYTDPNDVGNDNYNPGDEIVIQNGSYSGKSMDLYDSGISGNPIVLRAETAGGVILSGSRVRMNGNYCTVKWFMFTNINQETVSFRSSGTSYADNCRVTECAFIDDNGGTYKWVSFYGTYNRIDHCAFVNCSSSGAMITVWREDPSANYHQIDHNYIANREGGGVDVNGYETMRIGDSTESQSDSYSIIEYNYMSNIFNADIEFISSKSGRNIYRYNTFRGCGGGLTLRHGKNNTVEGNFFFGDGVDYTVGIRMTDSGHVIINNYIESLEGHTSSSKDMWNALVLMAGESSPALNGYWPVEDIIIAHNTFVNNPSTFTIGYENGGSVSPANITLANNCAYSPGNTIFDSSSGSTTGFGSGLVSEGNIMYGGSLGSDAPGSGITWTDPQLSDAGDYWRPDTGSPLINSAAGTYIMVSNDMDGQERDDGSKDIGADEVSGSAIVRGLLEHIDTGPPWYWGITGPTKPSSLALNPVSTSQINLSWVDESDDETGFYIYRSTTASKPGAPTYTLGPNVESYNDTGLSENTTYYYWVSAYNGEGESQSISSTATTLSVPPAAPSGFTVSGVSQSQIDLSWTDNSGNEDGFVIYRNTVNSKPATPVYTTAADAESWSDTGLVSGTLYYYWIEATNIAGVSSDLSGSDSTFSGPPEVMSTTPADGGTGIDTNTSQIIISFNTNMDGSSVAGAASLTGNGVSGLTYASGDGTKTIVLNITGNLENGEAYTFSLDTSAQSSVGINLGVPFNMSFSAGTIAAVYVHSIIGSDANPGTVDQPFATIDRAMTEMQDINKPSTALCYGTFTGNYDFVNGGTVGRQLLLTAWSNDDPPVCTNDGTLSTTWEFGSAAAAYIAIENWIFTGTVGASGNFIRVTGGENITISKCTFINMIAKRAISFENGINQANSNVIYNIAGSGGGAGIHIQSGASGVAGDLIIGNAIHTATADMRGIMIDSGAGTLVRNNTIVNIVDREGIRATVACTFHNNIIIGTGLDGIEGPAGSAGDYNLFNNNNPVYSGNVSGGGDDLTGTDPLFLSEDPFSADFLRLSSGSPAVDTGNPIYPVPSGGGSRIDRGAYEYVGGASDTTPPNVGISFGPTTSITTNQAFDIQLTTDEDLGYYRINAGGWTSFSGTTGSINISVDSTVEYYGEDVSGNNSGTNSVTYTFVATPVISIADISVNEGSGTGVLWVVLSSPAVFAASVDYVAVNASALSGVDYTAVSGTLTISAGQSSNFISIPISDDLMYESNENCLLNLSAPVNAVFGDDQAELTIQDNDLPPSVSILDISVDEGGGNAVFWIILTSVSALDTSVDYTTANGSALAGSDYTAISGSLNILAGQRSNSVSVSILDDGISESTESFTLGLSVPVNCSIADNQAVAAIIDNEALPVVTISDADVSETAGSATFWVILSGLSAQNVSVDYTTVDGTASATLDYTSVSGALTILAGQLSNSIVVTISDDLVYEGIETYSVDLSSPVNCSISDNQGVGTINDNESQPFVTITDSAVSETAGVATFWVVLSGASAQNVSVDFSTVNGTATSGSDYAAASGTLTISAGQLSNSITVAISDDLIFEGNESYMVDLSLPANCTILDGQADGIIGDNEIQPSVMITDAAVVETAGSATFWVILSGISAQNVIVDYTTVNGTAVAGSDYTGISGMLIINAGQLSNSITVPVSDDFVYEGNESFVIDLSAPINATISDNQGAGTVIDNETQPSVTINNTAVGETTGSAVFWVTISGVSAYNVSVDYTTVNGTAVAPSDYASAGGSLTIFAGQLSNSITVIISDDFLYEGNEIYTVGLSAPVNCNISDGLGTGVISDNEVQPSVSITDAAVSETAGTASFWVILSAVSALNASVAYTTTADTASAGSDYLSTSGTLIILAGTLSNSITVPVFNDITYEGNENFTVDLSSAVNCLISDNQGLGTIIEDDTVPSISISDKNVLETAGIMTFMVSLSAVCALDVSVDWVTADDTAVAGSDYTGIGGTLIVPAGSNTGTLSVTILDDGVAEGNETFHVNLSFPFNATISDAQAVGTITDNEGTPSLVISDSQASEMVGMIVFWVELSAISGSDVEVDYITSNGTALAGFDYTAVSGTLNILSGSLSNSFLVPINNDNLYEGAETFEIYLSNPTNALISDNQGLGTINDNDSVPLVTISDTAIEEGDGTAVFWVMLSGVSGLDASINYTTTDDTALSGADFTGTGGILTIPAGLLSNSISISVLDDAFNEAVETFTINLSTPVNCSITDNQALGTINDDDGLPSIIISDSSVSESDGSAVFWVEISSVSALDIGVNFSSSNGSALSGTDFSAVSGTLSIPAGSLSNSLAVPLNDDALYEGSENFGIYLSAPANALISDNLGLGMITDNENLMIRIDDIAVDDFTDNLAQLRVWSTCYAQEDITIYFTNIEGSAMEGIDYTGVSGSVTLTSGTSNIYISVPINMDMISEADEIFDIVLTGLSAGLIADATGVCTIADSLCLGMGAGDISVNEADGTASVSVWITGPAAADISFEYTTVDLSASAGLDYSLVSGTTFIPAGSTNISINIPVLQDTIVEGNESLQLIITNASLCSVIKDTAFVTINDDDSLGISISDVYVDEGAGTAAFWVELSTLSVLAVNVDYACSNGTAGSGFDYISVSGTASIPAGSLSNSIIVPLTDDSLDETNETFVLYLYNPVNATINDGLGVGSIMDNDLAPMISIADENGQESDGSIVFMVSLSTPSSLPVSVDYSTADNGAIAGEDFTSASGTLTIPAGQLSNTISVPVIDDNLDESNEDFYLNLGMAVNCTFADNQGRGDIIDNDAAPMISIADTNGMETATSMIFTVSLSAPSGQSVSFDWVSLNQDALAGSDFISNSSTLVIPAGSNTATITIVLNDDGFDEGDEIFLLQLSSPVNGSFSDDQAAGIIVDDDDTPVVSISTGPVTSLTTNQVFDIALSVTLPTGYYRINGGGWVSFTGTTGLLNIASTSTVEYYGQDLFGNNSGTNSVTYTVNVLNLPAPPSGLLVADMGAHQVDVYWTDEATNETGYVVYWSTISNLNLAASLQLPADTVTTSLYGLIANQTYYIWVAASNASGIQLAGPLPVQPQAAPRSREIKLRILPSLVTTQTADIRIEGIPQDISQISIYNLNGDLVASYEEFELEYDSEGQAFHLLSRPQALQKDGSRLPPGSYVVTVGEKVLYFTVSR